jgi:putative transcriptional regulator
MSKIYKITFENGYYLFKLEQVLEDKKISKNQIMRDTNTDFKVLKRLGTGELARVDITVLARLCDYLDCEMTDIFEYVPQKK